MDQQRRCLKGMVDGLPVLVAGEPDFTLLHTLDAAQAGDGNGRPFLDVVTMFACNRDGTDPANLRVFFGPPAGGLGVVVTIPAGEIVTVLNETPFGGEQSAPNGGALIQGQLETGQALSDSVSVWGWFVRSGG